MATDARRRCLTLPPNGLSLPPISSPSSGGSGSRYECLVEDWVSSDEDCLSETPFEAAMDVLEEEAEESAGWMTVTRRGRRSDKELQDEF